MGSTEQAWDLVLINKQACSMITYMTVSKIKANLQLMQGFLFFFNVTFIHLTRKKKMLHQVKINTSLSKLEENHKLSKSHIQ